MLKQLKGLFCSGFLRVCYRFLRFGVLRHASDIFLTQETLIAISLAGLVYMAAPIFGGRSGKLTDLALGFLGYAAIALGFCVGATTVALTFPDRDFLSKLATSQRKDKPGDALSGLLLVFSWTAIVHWIAIIYVAALLLFFGHREAPFLEVTSVKWRLVASGTCALCAYSLMQFLITVLSLWQAGTAFASDIRNKAAK